MRWSLHQRYVFHATDVYIDTYYLRRHVAIYLVQLTLVRQLYDSNHL